MAEISRIVATDCGSTTTKAILIDRVNGSYRLVARGEAPTTVEAPFDDVTVGVINSVAELEELTHSVLHADGRIAVPRTGKDGADLYVSTSSAGGGLQMLCSGVVKAMTAESAQRAALGAGAIVIDVLSVDDGRADFEKITRIRNIRPDMILMSGGTDGGTVDHLLDMAVLLRSADPRPRLGRGYRLPVIYAGNRDAREKVLAILKDTVDVRFVDNLRPILERENLGPAREAIHDLFLEHVMAQAPGYDKLSGWVSAEIMPTPMAVGEMVQLAARELKTTVLAVDIGGATTDVFSTFADTFNRTVSANLGLSYSVSNVLAEAGVENIARWLPMPISDGEIRNRLRNKMIRPTTIPQTMEDLLIEQAVAREALRLAFAHHKSLAVGLKGIQTQRTIADVFAQTATGQTLVNMMDLGLIIGSGGVLSHAPARWQAALMMMDAFQPEGITHLAVDSIFMMPHLGVLSRVNPEAAHEVFVKDCLISLGTCIAPVGEGKPGQPALKFEMSGHGIPSVSEELKVGDLRRLDLPAGKTAELVLHPARGMDAGAGRGHTVHTKAEGGVVGLIFDCRGRPLALPPDPDTRRRAVQSWLEAMRTEAGEAERVHL